jgi:hypothetical protein
MLVGAMFVALFVMAPSAGAAPKVIADGLFDPRGIADAPGDRLLVAQSGSGTITLIRDADGRNPRTSIFAELPDSGLVDVAASGFGRAFAVAGGAPEAGGGTFGQLLRVRRSGEPDVLADIAAYQEGDPDPDDQAEPPDPTESNANGLAVLGGGRFLVADAANNDLLKVDDGEITTVARFKPEEVPWPAGLPFPDQPPVGTPVLAEAVPTAVAVGPDGNWYVSELKGFPFHPGSSRIWRIKRGAENATCDPEQPNRACRTVETGFTSVIDLAFGDDGELYVLEIAKAGLLAVEFFNAPPIGGLWRVEDGKKKELARDELMAPGGVAVDDDNIYVTTGTIFGEGAGAVVRIKAPDEDRGRGDDDD